MRLRRWELVSRFEGRDWGWRRSFFTRHGAERRREELLPVVWLLGFELVVRRRRAR